MHIVLTLAATCGTANAADREPQMETIVVKAQRLETIAAPAVYDFSQLAITPPRVEHTERSAESEVIDLAQAGDAATKS